MRKRDVIKTAQMYPGQLPGELYDNVTLHGHIVLEFVDEFTGERTYKEFDNTVTNNLKIALANLLAGQLTGVPAYIALGKGGKDEIDISARDTDVVFNATTQQQLAASTLGASGALLNGTDVQYIILYLKRLGTPGGTVSVEIHSDTAGAPGALIGSASATLSINGIDNSAYAWYQFSFASPISLGSVTTYWTVAKTAGYSYSAGVNEFYWGMDSSAPAVTNGSRYNGTTWSATSPAGGFIQRGVTQLYNTATAVSNEIDRNAITARSRPSSYVTRLLAGFSAAEANDWIGHFGMFDAASSGNLLAIATTGFQKLSTQAINIYWAIGTQ